MSVEARGGGGRGGVGQRRGQSAKHGFRLQVVVVVVVVVVANVVVYVVVARGNRGSQAIGQHGTLVLSVVRSQWGRRHAAVGEGRG